MNKDSQLLWYEKPASAWTQALPIGNGTLGAMIYGKTGRETVCLNHDELWSGFPQDKSNKGSYIYFEQARALALEGKLLEAQTMIEERCLGAWTQAYMPLGDLILDFGKAPKPSAYRRSLDLETAVAAVDYTVGSTRFERTMFASFPAKVVVLHFTASEAGTLNFSVSMKCQMESSIYTRDGLLLLEGECPSEFNRNGENRDIVYYPEDERRGIRFLGAVKVECDGTVTASSQKLAIENATTATVYFTSESSFNGWRNSPFTQGKEYKETCLERIRRVTDYDALLKDHIADYRRYYDRVTLDLGSDGKDNLPTDKRLKMFERKKKDLALYTLLYNYGRYLTISCSREGSQPSNLQGIWNQLLCPPWNSNYTVNINTEMNYWPVLMCSMPEMNLPLVEMIKDISVSGRSTAKEHYNAPGFVCHHNVDLWRHTIPVRGSAVFAFWPMASGWLSRHLFEHYEYTQDLAFLRDTAYPIMKAAAQFYLACLVKDKDGFLMFAPSTSPENNFRFQGKNCSVSQTSTMTMSIIKDLFLNCIRAATILNEDTAFANDLAKTSETLLPFRIGSKGQLLEWYEEQEEAEPHHRHVSHLYALHPARLIDAEKTPDLAQACRQTLELRGDDGTGWSLGWKINFWARLRDGNRALRLIDKQLRFVKSSGFNYHGGGGTYANLFDAHPPFQIDGNFGSVSGITEMLMQSEPGIIHLLPALPQCWSSGRVTGLTAKGNIKVGIDWEDGRTTRYTLSGKGTVLVKLDGKETQHCLDGNDITVTV